MSYTELDRSVPRYATRGIINKVVNGVVYFNLPAFDNGISEFSAANYTPNAGQPLAVIEDDYGQFWQLGGSGGGKQGDKGDKGDTGAVGQTGPSGPQGLQGPVGLTGSTGLTGPQGVIGPVGPTGAASSVPGPTGATGNTGPMGPMGTVYDTDQVGTVKSFYGKVIPTNWMLADGRTLQRTSYPELADTMGIPTAQATFNLPDLRNKFIYGATDPTNQGGTSGEASHTLLNSEMPVHAHAGATAGGTSGLVSNDHTHAYSGTTSTQNQNHSHPGSTSNPGWSGTQGYNVWAPSGGANFVAITYSATLVGGDARKYDDFAHTHTFTTGAETQGFNFNYSGNTGGISANHNHSVPALGISNDGGGAAHNNMPPYILVAQIIKVTGVQVDSGGAIRGAAGQRGAIWYIYNGTGVPAANTFIGELDGDWCIRKTDGENFQRVSGAWVDQGFTNRSTAAVTSARASRIANLTVTANTAMKIPIDTLDYDVSGNLFNAANSRFVAPTTGVYQIDGQVTQHLGTGSTAMVCVAIVYVNGAQRTTGTRNPYSDSQGYSSSVISDTMRLTAGDYVELMIYSTSGADLYAALAAYNYLSMTLITAGSGPQGLKGDPGIPGTSVAVTARMYRGAAWTITAANAWVKIPVDTVSFDTAGIASAANGRINILTAGTYQVDANVVLHQNVSAAAYTAIAVGVQKNGGMICQNYSQPATSQFASAAVSDKIQCVPGDYLELIVVSGDAAATMNVGAGNNYLAVTQVTSGPGPQGPKGDPGSPITSNQVFTFSGQDLTNPILCTFVGLDPSQDIEYEIILDLLVTNAAANFYCWAQPNGVSTSMQNWVEHRTFTDGTTVTTNDLATVGTGRVQPFGYACGHADWNTGGRMHCAARISALSIPGQGAANVGRLGTHEGTFVPNGSSAYVMNWHGATTWWDANTNYTQLRIGCWNITGGGLAGSLASGRCSLRIIK